MKTLLMIPLAIFSACVSHAPRKSPVVAITPFSRPVSAGGLRAGEQLCEYRFGRYVDPGDPLVMHEGHPVFRIERSAEWNLRPGNGNPFTPGKVVAASNVTANDAVIAELNKQRVATRAVTDQAARLNQSVGEMTQAAAQSQVLAKQGLVLQRDITTLRERLDAFDAQLRERKPSTSGSQPPRTEDKW